MSQPPDQPAESESTVVHSDSVPAESESTVVHSDSVPAESESTVVHSDSGSAEAGPERTAHIPNPTAPAQVYIPSSQAPSSDLHTARTQERGAFTPPAPPPGPPLAPIYGKAPQQHSDPAPWYQQPVERPQNPPVDAPPSAYGPPAMPGVGIPSGYPVLPGAPVGYPGAPAGYPGAVPPQADYPGAPSPQGWGYPPGLAEPPKKRSRKKWVVSGLTLLVIALAGGGAAAYFLYFSGARDRGAISTAATEFTRAAVAGDPTGVREALCEAEASALPELSVPSGAEVVQDDDLQVAVNAVEVRKDVASATVSIGGDPDVTLYFRQESGGWKVCASAKDDFTANK